MGKRKKTVEEELATAAGMLAAAVSYRDAVIVAAHEAGLTDRAIAQLAGITHPTVARILRDAGAR